jgi:hypothetical protein
MHVLISLLASNLERICLRMGDLHFSMAVYESIERIIEKAGWNSILQHLGRGDTMNSGNLSKAFQTHRLVMDEVFEGRMCAFFIEQLDGVSFPSPSNLFPSGTKWWCLFDRICVVHCIVLTMSSILYISFLRCFKC